MYVQLSRLGVVVLGTTDCRGLRFRGLVDARSRR